MLSKRMQEEVNKQINEETFSAYLYLSMSAYFEDLNLAGFANWMKVQYKEETFHSDKFFDFMNERGGRVVLEAIQKPKYDWENILDVFEDTLKHEQHVTARINEMMRVAIDENDYASIAFLQWYVNEQVEEEKNVNDILSQLKFLGENKHGILMLDRELKQRVFVEPTSGGN
jgi:ferritin